jgi:transcriptional regulator with PAS, ATPase and Fis domain
MFCSAVFAGLTRDWFLVKNISAMNTSPSGIAVEQLVHESEQRLRFEQLISDLSARFINLPTDRVEDIPLLVWTFVNEFGKKMGKKIQKISKTTMETFLRKTWKMLSPSPTRNYG